LWKNNSLRYPVLNEWNSTGKRPKNLPTLIRTGGIPEALRCQLWQKLSKTDENSELSDNYRVLITKESKCEDIILRDVHRTFPAHESFREKSGMGQESLYKVSRAYSVYDTGNMTMTHLKITHENNTFTFRNRLLPGSIVYCGNAIVAYAGRGVVPSSSGHNVQLRSS
jgi:hypothetical protein